jgi:methylenetetrahydrofolate reductase (NADPH)
MSCSIGDKEQGIRFLREKVEAGADFIVTQLFYDADAFINFVDDCRDSGIKCPIIPGILPIQNYSGFKKMTDFCKLKVPEQIWTDLRPIKDNDEAVKEYGVQLAQNMCKRILSPENKNRVQGVHFYTLNLERSVRNILDGLGVRYDCASRRPLPWRPSTTPGRSHEDVRPIFWANRPTSYLQRTSSWDEFPNGRWGDNRSPAYGEVHQMSHFGNHTCIVSLLLLNVCRLAVFPDLALLLSPPPIHHHPIANTNFNRERSIVHLRLNCVCFAYSTLPSWIDPGMQSHVG